MGDQLEEALVGDAWPEAESVDEEDGTVSMLEPAAPRGQVMDERVALVRHPTEKFALGLHDRARVLDELRLVFVSPAPKRDAMRDAVDREFEHPMRAAFDGAVDELVVVARTKPEHAVAPSHGLEARGDLPAWRRRDLEVHRLVSPAEEEHERRRAVGKAVGPIEVVGAHGEIVRVDAITHADAPTEGRLDAPRVLCRLLPTGLVTVARHREILHVACVFANHVRARGP